MKKLILLLVAAAVTLGVATTSVSAQEHEVEKGDTLWDIANEYNIQVDKLMNTNELNNTIIHPEQMLKIDSDASAVPSKNNTDKASKSKEENKNMDQSEDPEGETLSVEATAYTASCEGCSGVTATGIDLKANPDKKVIAVDPDVIPLGSKVYVEGYGYATADDTGGDIKGDRIDLFVHSKDEAFDFGRQSVDVTIVE